MHLSRSSGILLPVTSLPGPWPAGDLGNEAFAFADFLQKAGQAWWQVLPAGPTDTAMDNSPYSSPSAFAGNPLFINPENLVPRGYLEKEDVSRNKRRGESSRCDYSKARLLKEPLFRRAWEHFPPSVTERDSFEKFREEHVGWLADYALYAAIKDHMEGKPWHRWPEDLRDRHPGGLKAAESRLSSEIAYRVFLQFLFYSQWESLRQHCAEKGVGLIGDMPIYVSHDSTDVWANRTFFRLDGAGSPLESAGVPPDYFSDTGQLWGNPIYRWDALKKGGYSWWISRIRHNLRLYDLVRIDHFRGFIDFWAVPAGERTAVNGHWERGPGREFFRALERNIPGLPLLAENLGTITPEVTEIMREFGLPGMVVLLFAFGADFGESPYAPHNHCFNDFVYTGTHDNNTARGWFEEELDGEGKDILSRYLGHVPRRENVHQDLVRLAFQSVAKVSIVPMQDFLGLGAGARLNTPATPDGNWRWRARSKGISGTLAGEILSLTELTGRERPDLREHPDLVR